jgi:uncharacterized membrane protein YdfJ with MMPL/SSD domain
VVFSGTTVAIALALLIALPVPFTRSMGVGGFLIPLISIAAAVTLQPALLSLYGVRGTKRARAADSLRRRFRLPLPRIAGADVVEHGFWARPRPSRLHCHGSNSSRHAAALPALLDL